MSKVKGEREKVHTGHTEMVIQVIQKWFVELGVEELDWPASNTFGMNWNADC